MDNSTLSNNATIPIERITGTIENTMKGCNITFPCSSEETVNAMHSTIASILPSSLSLLTIVICIAIGIYRYRTSLPGEIQQPGFTHGASGTAALGNISFPENVYMRERGTLRRIDTGDSELSTYTAVAGSRECIVCIDPPAYGVNLPGYSAET